MYNSKDLSIAIIFAVLGLVYAVFVVQMASLITGISGVTFFFIIGFAIFISCQLLVYEGRRWLFFVSTTLFMILIIPIPFAGASYDILARIPIIINAFIGDILFNSVYRFFKSRNKLIVLTLLFSVQYHVMNSFLSITLYYLFYSPEALAAYISIISVMLPVIIIESIAGGYIGFKVYERVKKIQ